MKKNFVILLAVLSMFFFVSCGGDDEEPEKSEKNGGQNDAEQVNDADSEENDNGQTDVKDDADEPAETADDDAEEPAETPDNNDEPIDDSKCETVVYKSKDVRKMDVNEIDIWLYDSETYEDETPPLFYVEAYFTEDVTELKGQTISLKNLDPNKEDGTRVFFYTDFDASMWWFAKNYIAKSGSFHIEDVDADDYTKLKIDTTDIVFFELSIDEENGLYNEVPNGKCYKLEALEWDSISAAGE